MKRLDVTMYRYRGDLKVDDLRELTKKFAVVGAAPGVLVHYTRLDGMGGFIVQETPEDPGKTFETIIQYAPWMEFEVIPVTTIEDSFPVIQSLYG